MSEPTNTSDIHSKVAQTRAQLESTLDEIEDKLNVPKQIGITGRKLQAKYEDDPTPFIAAAVGVATAIGGLVVWSLVRRS
ncbi:DUF3618 domain-containing protein [Marisediminicola sp. LYQ134]|uniref:DUF3618 domain-containing protein n=1 Tax=unclassified Marisediminicola TaxID=2618316 RepID=UPI003983BB24